MKRPGKVQMLLIAVIGLSIVGIGSLAAQEGQLVDIVVHSPALEGNLLGDSADRGVTVYLPPGYDNPGQRYPVLYLLHGYTATNQMWRGTQYISGLFIGRIADDLIAEGQMQPMILVMPDAENTYWGSWYANSSVTGNWEDFIVRDLVAYIDDAYRTLPQPASRGIAGHSMGGHGAMKLAIKHPEVYSVVYAMSAAAIAMDVFITGAQDNIIKAQTWDAFGSKDFDNWLVKINIASAAAFSPNPDSAPFMADFPYKETDGEVSVIETVWQQWLAHDPVTLLSTHDGNLQQFRGIRIDCGRADFLIGENRVFAQALSDAGIPHDFIEYQGNHTNRVRQRMGEHVLPYFSETLSFEMGPTAVEEAAWGAVKLYFRP